MDKLNEAAADYLLLLERGVANGMTLREALQKAFSLGATSGRIAGLDIAKEIIGGPKP